MATLTTSAQPDVYSSVQPDINNIYNLAEQLSLELSPERAGHLESIGAYYRNLTLTKEASRWHQGNFPMFEEFGLQVGLALKIGSCDYDKVQINFRPRINNETHDERVPSDLWLDTILKAITNLQNYCLLAEAGFIREPTTISGLTNLEMARFSQRAGFRMVGSTSVVGKVLEEVTASYSDLVEHLFAPKVARLCKMVDKRVTRS